jgi:hypothetical protein
MKTLQQKQPKLTLSFPKAEVRLKKELSRMKVEEHINLNAFILSCIKKEIGYY